LHTGHHANLIAFDRVNLLDDDVRNAALQQVRSYGFDASDFDCTPTTLFGLWNDDAHLAPLVPVVLPQSLHELVEDCPHLGRECCRAVRELDLR
jgi:hypothetical protein